jgi:hypothetical protein
MAPTLLSSRQTGWSRSDTPNMARRYTLVAVVMLLLGIAIGIGIKSIGGNGQPVADDKTVIANANLSDIKSAPQTTDGAVRAVTSYITGFPSVALMSTSDQRAILNEIVSPTADPSLKNDLQTLATQGRQRILGSGSVGDTVTARMVVAPASYKVDMLAPDRARVQIWYLSVFIDASGQTAQSSWTTNDIQVQWSDHWRIAQYAAKGGPTPALFSDKQEPSTFAEMLTVFNGFKAFRYAPAVPAEK